MGYFKQEYNDGKIIERDYQKGLESLSAEYHPNGYVEFGYNKSGKGEGVFAVRKSDEFIKEIYQDGEKIEWKKLKE